MKQEIVTVKPYTVVKSGFLACRRSGRECDLSVMDAAGVLDRCHQHDADLRRAVTEGTAALGEHRCRYFSKNRSQRVCRYDSRCDGASGPGGGNFPLFTYCSDEGCLVGNISTTPGNTSEYEISEAIFRVTKEPARCKNGW